MEFQYSINRKMHNKNRKASDDYHWELVRSETNVLLEHILAGHAICPAVLKDYSKVRNLENFKRSQLFMIDIDNADKDGKKIKLGYFGFDDAQNDQFIRRNGLLLYTTPSHTEDWHKFRIVFFSNKRIYDKEEYKQLITKLIHAYNSDPSTSSGATYFYGNTEALYVTYENELDISLVQRMSDNRTDQSDFEEEARHTYNGNITKELAKQMLSAIGPMPGYDVWFQCVSAIGNYFDKNEAIDLVNEWSPDKNQGTEYKIEHRYKKFGIGTLIYHAKEAGFDISQLPRSKKKKKENYNELKTHDGFEYSDLGNSRRLIAKYGANLKYNNTDGNWYRWNGTCWLKDEKNHVFEYTKLIVDELKIVDFNSPSANDQVRHFKKSGDRSRLTSMLALAETVPGISKLTTDFDQDHYKINLQNVVYDLKTDTTKPHDRELLQTKLMPIDYEPDAQCPKWIEFLEDVTDKNYELISFIQRALGLTLCGDGLEEILFFAFGTGKNGKSIFFNVITSLFGSYFMKAPTSMIIMKKADGIPNDIAMLPGARLVVPGEIEEGKRLDEAVVKDLTGNDVISARFLHKEFFKFKPTHTLWLYGNHKPLIRGSDEGIWRRICLIPFKVTIAPEKRRDPSDLVDDILTEKSGILNWMLDGWADYTQKGLQQPSIVTHESSRYRTDQDILGLFFEDVCLDDPSTHVVATEIYEMYEFWCKENREHPIKNRTFYAKIEERGYEKGILPKGRTRIFKGLDLHNEWQENLRKMKDNRKGQNGLY
jgi:P4 family phage/plasmid primase-like protien